MSTITKVAALQLQLQKRKRDLDAAAGKMASDKLQAENAELKKGLEELRKQVGEIHDKRKRSAIEEPVNTSESPLLAAHPMDRLLKMSSDRQEVKDFHDIVDGLFLLAKSRRCEIVQLPKWEKASAHLLSLAKAMNTQVAADGANWIPTDFSSTLYRQIELETLIAGLFVNVPMPTATFKLPIDVSGLTIYLMPESQSDNPQEIPSTTSAVSNNSLVAKKLACRTMMSTEIGEDSAVDIAGFMRDRLARAIAAGIDDAILNGDTAGTHQDTNVTSALDRRKAFLGLRALAVDGSASAAIAGTNVAETDLRLARKAMRAYGVRPRDLRLITGPLGYLEMLNRFTNFQTIDKIGAAAVALTGQLGAFDGIPVIVSDQMPENLNNTGVYDGSTTDKTSALLVYTPGIVLGTMRGITVKTAEKISTDQVEMVLTNRRAMINLYAPTTTAKFLYQVTKIS